MSEEYVCGIDFGTSNTAMSIISNEDDKARLVSLDGQHETAPTAIFFAADHPQRALYGRAAVAAYREHHDGRFMRSLKRALGTSLMADGTLVNGRRTPFEEIIAGFLTHIKTTAETQLGHSLTKVVAGRPVHFVDGDNTRDAQAQAQLEHAFKRAGFRDVAFQFEPIAAAFAHESTLDNHEYLAVVLDIGGGTSDFSIIKLSHRYLAKANRQDDVLGNTGIRLGGNDFDKKLSLRDYMPLFGLGTTIGERGLPFPSTVFFDLSEWSKIPFVYAPKYRRDVKDICTRANDQQKADRLLHLVNDEYGHALLDQVEHAKICLSHAEQTTSDLGFIEHGLQRIIHRAGFEEAMHQECAAITKTLEECTRQAGVRATDITLAILTGGGTGIPAIRDVARRTFPQARITNDNMLASVGLGLSYDAARLFL